MPNPLKDIGDIPIDIDNEGLIIANAIKNSDNRKEFLNRIDYLEFRQAEYQTLAWSIKSTVESEMELNPDAILLKSRKSPVRKPLDYNFIVSLTEKFNEVPKTNYIGHLEKLKVDSVKAKILDRIFDSIYKSLIDPTSDLSAIEKRIQSVQDIIEDGFSSAQCEFKGMDVVVPEYIKSRDVSPGKRKTYFRPLDELLTDGLQDGTITIICGLPSQGKSSFALSLMKNLSNRSVYAAQFALEMPNRSLMHKLIAFKTNLAVTTVANYWRTLSDKEKDVYEYEIDLLSKNKYLYFNDKPSQSMSNIRDQIRRLQDKLREQYLVIIIDLFGKISDLSRSDNFARSYEQQLNEAQQMARALGIHLIPVAQINREAVKNKFRRPRMSDLKNAGAFEEVADLILAVHRPYYNPELALTGQLRSPFDDSEEEEEATTPMEHDPNRNLAEIIILKQRMGENNKIINFYFDPRTTRLDPIESAYQNILNEIKFMDFKKEDDGW